MRFGQFLRSFVSRKEGPALSLRLVAAVLLAANAFVATVGAFVLVDMMEGDDDSPRGTEVGYVGADAGGTTGDALQHWLQQHPGSRVLDVEPVTFQGMLVGHEILYEP